MITKDSRSSDLCSQRPRREEASGEVFPEWAGPELCPPGCFGQVVSDKVPDKGSDCNRQLDRAGRANVAGAALRTASSLDM